jgi:hypothetical protein
VARNASILIFDPNDPAKTPVTLTDVTGSPVANPIQVNQHGFGPAIKHATLDRLAWEGAGMSGVFTSYEGMKEEAVAAREAAQTAASEAAAAAQADLEARIASGVFKGEKGADGSNVLPTDAAIQQAINDTASATRGALNATFAAKGEAGNSGYDVILLAGQSNMSGRGTPYSATTDPGQPMIFQYKGKAPNKGTIIPAAEPLDMVDTPNGIGPGFQFARWYVANGLNNGRKVLLVPTAQGGTPLTRVATPTWKPSVTGSLYSNAISQANGAIAAEAGSKIVAVLWLQGETDGDLNASGTDYQADFDALINGFRANITGAATVPFILAGMVPEYLGTGTRQAINNVHGDTPNRITRTAYVPPPTASHLGDGNHYNAAGARKIAEDMFTAYMRVFTGLPAAFAFTPPPNYALGTTRAAERTYSLRKTNSDYLGKAVKVRRASDNTTQDIGFSGTALDTSALLAFAGSGDAFVDTWYDQSGKGKHLAQADVAKQPKIVTAGAVITSGGKPAVQFDGADDHLFSTSAVGLYALGSATHFAVVNGAAQALSRVISEANTSFSDQQYSPIIAAAGGTGNLNFQINIQSGQVGDTGSTAPAAFNGTINQVSVVDTGTNMAGYVNAAAVRTTAYTRGGVANLTNLSMGAMKRTTDGQFFNGLISEVITFATGLGTTDRQAIEANQKAFYGTP